MHKQVKTSNRASPTPMCLLRNVQQHKNLKSRPFEIPQTCCVTQTLWTYHDRQPSQLFLCILCPFPSSRHHHHALYKELNFLREGYCVKKQLHRQLFLYRLWQNGYLSSQKGEVRWLSLRCASKKTYITAISREVFGIGNLHIRTNIFLAIFSKNRT